MKIVKIFLCCFLFSSVGLFSSCENEPYEGEINSSDPDNENPDDGDNPAVFQVEVNGDLFVGDQVDALNNEDGLQISAQTGAEVFGLQIFEPAVGSYDFSDETLGLLVYTADVADEESPSYYLSEGIVTVTEINNTNNTISGTFNGTLTEWFEEAEDIVLTNGVFENIPYSTAAPADHATAMIDGEVFNANTFATVEAGNALALNFMSNTNENLVLNLPAGNINTGTHAIESAGGSYSGMYSFVEGTQPQTYSSVAGSGSINITSTQNGIITGTFAFNVAPFGNTTPTLEITEGEFSIDIN